MTKSQQEDLLSSLVSYKKNKPYHSFTDTAGAKVGEWWSFIKHKRTSSINKGWAHKYCSHCSFCL